MLAVPSRRTGQVWCAMQVLHANVHWLVLVHSKTIHLPSVIPIRWKLLRRNISIPSSGRHFLVCSMVFIEIRGCENIIFKQSCKSPPQYFVQDHLDLLISTVFQPGDK